MANRVLSTKLGVKFLVYFHRTFRGYSADRDFDGGRGGGTWGPSNRRGSQDSQGGGQRWDNRGNDRGGGWDGGK